MMPLLPRATLGAGAILRWHLVDPWLPAFGRDPAGLLDVGCGRGEYVARLARRFPSARRVVGVDRAGRDGVTRFAPVPPDVESRVVLREAEFSSEIVLDVGPFDGVVCVDVLEHVADDARFLADLATVVRPRGRAIVHVPASPQRHPIGWTRRELERMLLDGSGEHVREGYTREGIARLLRESGWTISRERATFGRVAAWWCDADFYLASRGVHALRALALPLTVGGALIGRGVGPQRGNGWLFLLERR
ncbi:MAG TPA: methyltransferase domain-containing protein [Dongiaceae bacterium]|nr:methyltransferase domain-containing protein [Dongiaceae bacterium]